MRSTVAAVLLLIATGTPSLGAPLEAARAHVDAERASSRPLLPMSISSPPTSFERMIPIVGGPGLPPTGEPRTGEFAGAAVIGAYLLYRARTTRIV